jgi:SPP1 family predicted phage head-tail adaptor
MRAGSLDRRIELQHRTLTQNAQHENIESFATYATVWAGKADLVGREFFAAEQVQAETATKFRLRYRDDVLLTDRLVCNGVTYDLKHVAEIGRREGLEIIATAKVL